MLADRRLRYGMVGGGPGAFIGEIHRKAAALDGEIELVAGAFSSDPDRSREQGARLHLEGDRVYESYRAMAEGEASRPADRRIDFVSIVTPNHLHHDAARASLEAGFHVVCDKPMTNTVEEAESLRTLVAERDAVFAVTYNYTGYPMLKQARTLARSGALGRIRRAGIDYAQGWLASPLELEGHKQAEWRTDPTRAGVAGALGDIGTHAENLLAYVTGLELEALCADFRSFVEGRALEDDASLLLRFQGGARGTLTVSQVSVGEDNDLCLRVYGTEAGLVWRHREPDRLRVLRREGPEEVWTRGHPYLGPEAIRASRLPPGHPEGFIEAFANIYGTAGRTMAARIAGRDPDPMDLDLPTVDDGARGVHFLHRAVESAESGGWVDASYAPA